MAELNDSVDKFNDGLEKALKTLTSINREGDKTPGKMGKAAGSLRSLFAGGSRGNMQGSTSQMSHMEGKFDSNVDSSFREYHRESLREISGFYNPRGATALGVGQGVAQATFGVLGGAMMAMPSVAEVGTSASNYYGASLMSGGMSRQAIRGATFSGLAGGVTSTLGPSNAAAILAARGIMPGSAQYNAMISQIGGAARAYNMTNENAAISLSGLTQGGMSSRLYNIGISTFNAKTGEMRDPNQIFEQLYGRMTVGREKMTPKAMMASIQAGTAQDTANALGMDENQKSLFYKFLMAKAGGTQSDLSKLGYGANPNQDKLRITTSDTSVLNKYEQPMLDGMKAAADLIVNTVNPALEGMASTAGKVQGFLGGLGESRAGAGLGVMVGGILSGVTTIVGMLAASRLLGAGASALGATGAAGAFGSMSAGAAGVAVAGTAVASAGAGYVTGKGAKVIGNAIGANAGVTRAGGAAAGAGVGALIGTAILPGVGTVVGSILGGIGGFFGSGGGAPGFGGSFGGASLGSSNPLSLGTPNVGYGVSGSQWSGGVHKGVDYPYPMGTPVPAVLGGVVINTSPSADYGKTVEIDHGNGYQTLYGHLSEVLVKVGQPVNKGDIIGKSGDTGKVNGPHLHYEVRRGKNNPVNPDELSKAGDVGSAGGSQLASTLSGVTSELVPLSKTYGTRSGLDAINNLSTSLALGGAAGAGGGGGSNGTPGVILGTGDQKDFAAKLISRLGGNATPEAIAAITTWMAHEGGHWKNSANYNPLNTTLDMSNNESMNSVGVKRYKSWEEGLGATVNTLTGKNADARGYSAIVNALRSGGSTADILSAISNSAWVTGKTGQNSYKGFSGGGTVGVATPSMGGGATVIAPQISINVTVARASEAEAMNLVTIVKRELEKDTMYRITGNN